MKRFNTITIIGVGLIGGSVGLAIKKRKLAKEVVGVFRRASTMRRALKRKAIDKGTLSIEEGVASADLIIITTPVHLIPDMARQASAYAKPGAVITDAGSTKQWIVGKIEKLVARKPGLFFVGSHPMAGSEHAGVEFATDGLMAGSPCIVTKTRRTDRAALDKVARFWKALGARVKVMSPADHDRSVSLVSHLPHVVAFSLAGAVPAQDLAYAAEGFKDTTRVASSDPALWADIFLTNRKEVVKACRAFEKYYAKVVAALAKGNYRRTVQVLGYAKSKRDRFIHAKGA